MMPINRSAQHNGETVLYVKQDHEELMTRMATVEESLFVIPKSKFVKKVVPVNPKERASKIPDVPY